MRVPINLKDLWECEDPSFIAFAWAVAFDAAEMAEKAQT